MHPANFKKENKTPEAVNETVNYCLICEYYEDISGWGGCCTVGTCIQDEDFHTADFHLKEEPDGQD